MLILHCLCKSCKFTSSSVSDILTGEVVQANIPQMYYSGFPEQINGKWKIILEGRPLNTFCSPLQLMTKNKVEMIYNACKTGTENFHHLSYDEWKEWDAAQFQSVTFHNTLG